MQDYTTIIGVITMRCNNCSFSVIQNRYHIGSSTVQLILKRFEQSGLSIEQLKELTPEELERVFYPPDNLRKKNLPYPDFQLYYDKMHLKDSKINLSYCWIDYRQKHPDGYGQSQFYDLYRAFEKKNTENVIQGWLLNEIRVKRCILTGLVINLISWQTRIPENLAAFTYL